MGPALGKIYSCEDSLSVEQTTLEGAGLITISAGFDPEGKPRKPGALCIGAQKAGTSWLAQMLGQHSQVWIPPFKEAQYFNQLFIPEHRRWIAWHYRNKPQEIRQRHKMRGVLMPPELDSYFEGLIRGRMFHNQWYKRVFAPAPANAVPMDFTPEYSTLPEEGVEYVADFLPRVRVIYLIRDPIQRVISQLRMNLRREKREPQTHDDWLAELDDPALYDRGDYATYVPRWLRHFRREQVLFLPFGRIASDPAGVMQLVERHLGVGPISYQHLDQKVFATPAGLLPPSEVIAALSARLAPQMDFLRDNFDADFVTQLR